MCRASPESTPLASVTITIGAADATAFANGKWSLTFSDTMYYMVYS